VTGSLKLCAAVIRHDNECIIKVASSSVRH